MSAERDSRSILPPLALSARSLAVRTGRRKRTLVAVRLFLVTLAALFGALTIVGAYSKQRLDYAGVAGVLCFIAVLGVRMTMQSDPDLESGEPRANAVADLVTSHAWRYAVGARPYTVGNPELDKIAGDQFTNNVVKYQDVLTEYATTAPVSAQITDEMRILRASDLENRRARYLGERIERLQATSERTGIRLGGRWRILTALVLLVELLGIPGGVLKAVEITRIDLLGVTGAAAASIALWVETLNLQDRRRAATAIGKNLVTASDWLKEARTEDEWAAKAAWVEEQLSLEQEAFLAPDTAARRRDPQIVDVHTMSPEEYFAAATTLKRQIWDGTGNLPKLEPDVIVAVNPGGAILGGILYFMTRASDFLPLSLRGGLDDEELESMLNAAPWQPRQHHLSILLVDASIKSGGSLLKAIELVRKVVEAKGFVADGDGTGHDVKTRRYILRTAVIARRKVDPQQRDSVQVDYFVNDSTERFPYGTI